MTSFASIFRQCLYATETTQSSFDDRLQA